MGGSFDARYDGHATNTEFAYLVPCARRSSSVHYVCANNCYLLNPCQCAVCPLAPIRYRRSLYGVTPAITVLLAGFRYLQPYPVTHGSNWALWR